MRIRATGLLLAIAGLATSVPAVGDDAPVVPLEPATLGEGDRSLARLVELRRARLEAAGFGRRALGEGERRLVWFEAGAGPPLVLLHGAGDQAATWFDVAPAFTASYRVVVPDLPGHGESAPAGGPLAMSRVVAGAEALLAEVAGERRAIVVGNSMGAWIATLLAHRHPERVERVVLINGGAVPAAPGGPSLLPADREAARRLMALLRDPASPQLPDWMLDDLVARAPTSATARLLGELSDLVAQMLVGRLGEVRTPADLVWGASDGLMTVAYAEQMAAALPAARLTRIDGCGHLPQLECPARLRAALAERLAAPPPAPVADAGAP